MTNIVRYRWTITATGESGILTIDRDVDRRDALTIAKSTISPRVNLLTIIYE